MFLKKFVNHFDEKMHKCHSSQKIFFSTFKEGTMVKFDMAYERLLKAATVLLQLSNFYSPLRIGVKTLSMKHIFGIVHLHLHFSFKFILF